MFGQKGLSKAPRGMVWALSANYYTNIDSSGDLGLGKRSDLVRFCNQVVDLGEIKDFLKTTPVSFLLVYLVYSNVPLDFKRV